METELNVLHTHIDYIKNDITSVKNSIKELTGSFKEVTEALRIVSVAIDKYTENQRHFDSRITVAENLIDYKLNTIDEIKNECKREIEKLESYVKGEFSDRLFFSLWLGDNIKGIWKRLGGFVVILALLGMVASIFGISAIEIYQSYKEIK